MATPAMIQLTGVDNSVWTLAGPGQAQQGVELGTNPSGIYDAPVTTIWNQSAFQIGSTFAGYKIPKRDVVFGVNIFELPGMSWQSVDSAWRRAWAYDQDSTLTITTETGTRSLLLRMSQQPSMSSVHDPHLKLWAQVTMTCTAGIPWWVEQDSTQNWVAPIDTTGGAITSGTILIENPTDQAMYLKWVCSAPAQWTLPDFSWGNNFYGRASTDANRVITLPRTSAGQDLTVDTDPMAEMIVAADGSLMWALMGGVSFEYAVPPYTKSTAVPVSVTYAPAGASVMCVQPRNWSRPWGGQ
ncbi:phage tail protein [Nocardia sp. NBC_01327]|uniref:phage tail protein n=1 Tax=Nocardia sp. NBC_01327 TaxID=2903593 RepID=UPI002E0E35E5|nr:phage tail protein [Nocardia sp. NBC_01327]